MGKHRIRNSHSAADTTTDVRRAVLDGALDIIANEGAEAVSMREVARRAGVSHQAPYHYFGDRAGIFAAIAEEGFRSFTESFRHALTLPGDVVANYLRSYVLFAITHKGHYRVMFRADICGIHTHEQTKGAADEAFLALLDLAETVSPTTDPANAMTFPVALWAQAHGLATLIIDSPLLDKLPPDTNIEDFVDKVANITTWSKSDINN